MLAPEGSWGLACRIVRFETELTDALYVTWSVPSSALPQLPAALTLDTVSREGGSFGFVTLVLFRQSGLRRPRIPWLRLSFPQCNLRVPVRDTERCASILLIRELVPAWVVPIARAIAKQPVSAGLLRFPEQPGADLARWHVQAGRALTLEVRAGDPAGGLTGWEERVRFLRDRRRAYVLRAGVLRRTEATHEGGAAVPVSVRVESADWLAGELPAVPAASWAAPVCGFLVPSSQLAFELQPALPDRPPARLPAPSMPG